MTKKILLVVDDEPDFVKVLATRLRDRGYEVDSALTAGQAMDRIKLKKPDLIILDIMMPETDGPEMANKLRNDRETDKIPIIFLSAIITKSEEGRPGDPIGGNIILAKPYEIDELEGIIIKQLGGS